MILHGRNLILKRNGIALYACKTCTLDVQQTSIPVSSPANGIWEDSIGGRKSWSMSSGHLICTTVNPAYSIEVTSIAHDSLRPLYGMALVNGVQHNMAGRGFDMLEIVNGNIVNVQSFDTYGDTDPESEAQCNALADAINALTAQQSTKVVALVSGDAIGMTTDLKNTIQTFFKVDMSMVRLGRTRSALAVIGGYAIQKGSIGYAGYYTLPGNKALATMYMNSQDLPLDETPLRTSVNTVGQEFDIEVCVSGLPLDKLSGRVRCQTVNIQGTRGSLMQGSFKWIGLGPLT